MGVSFTWEVVGPVEEEIPAERGQGAFDCELIALAVGMKTPVGLGEIFESPEQQQTCLGDGTQVVGSEGRKIPRILVLCDPEGL